ncbi:hypothetical protein ACP70R_009623 [Stipagrostis hirtigluma subsp. patula]
MANSMAGRRLELHDLARPLVRILPEIRSPGRAIPLRQKVAVTAVSVLIFLVGSQLPLYGIRHKSDTDDPLYWTQAASIANSNPGIANGIITLLLSEGLLHPLLRLRILKLDNGVPEDQMLLNGLQKLLGILIAAASSIGKVLVSTIADKLSTGQTILIVLQLFFGGVIVIYLDDLLRKGYGLLSGIPLFTTTKICFGHMKGPNCPLVCTHVRLQLYVYTYTLDRSGALFFISGVEAYCRANEKVIVMVLNSSLVAATAQMARQRRAAPRHRRRRRHLLLLLPMPPRRRRPRLLPRPLRPPCHLCLPARLLPLPQLLLR